DAEPASTADGLRAAPKGKRVVWPELPGTRREQQQVLDLARKALGTAPLGLSGSDASTDRLPRELPKARYAHLATHGFFADPQFRSAFKCDDMQVVRRPWVRAT